MGVGEQTIGAFLEALGGKSPTPGGGAVAAIVAALGSALGQMVVAYSVDRKSLAEHKPALEDATARLTRARAVLLELADADAEAYGQLNEAMKRSKDDPGRTQAMAEAARGAIVPPRAAMALCVDLLRLFEDLAEKTNPMLRSDLVIAAILAEAGVRASAQNVRVNLSLLGDEKASTEFEAEGARSCEEAARRCAAVHG
jgi:methenyltetrahydrofolate cyclohydrolase